MRTLLSRYSGACRSGDTSGRNRKALPLAALVVAIAMIMSTVLFGATRANAAELSENVITSAELSSKTIRPYQTVELKMGFALPNNVANEGDTSTIRLPEGFAFYTAHEFDVTSPQGDVIAHAKIDKQAGTLTLTYTKYVEQHSDITGSIRAAFVLSSNDQQQGTREIILDVNGKKVHVGSIEVKPSEGDNPNELFAKYGYQIRESKQDMMFVLRVNGRSDDLQQVRVTDQLGSAGLEYDRSSFEVLKGNWGLNARGEYELQNVENVTDQIKPQFSDDGRGFSMDLGDLPGKGVRVRYKAKVKYAPQHNEQFYNTAKMTAQKGKEPGAKAYVVWQSASGEANGYNYAIKVAKTSEDGSKPLAGAEFSVVRNRSGEQVGTIVTGEDGTGSITGLLRDDYTITETRAPEGYEVTNQSLSVTADDFDASTMTATLCVTNKLKPEEPKPEEPQPEQPKPEQPKPEQPKPEQPKKPEPKKPAQQPKQKGTPLASTGSSVLIIVGVAVVLVAAGATTMILMNKRRTK